MQYCCKKSCFHKHDVISGALKCLKTYHSLAAAVEKSCTGSNSWRQTCCSRQTCQAEGGDRQNKTTDDSRVSEGPIGELCSHACVHRAAHWTGTAHACWKHDGSQTWRFKGIQARLGNRSQYYCSMPLSELFTTLNKGGGSKRSLLVCGPSRNWI